TFSVAGVPEGHYFLQIDQPAQRVGSDGVSVEGYDRWLVEQTTNTPDLSSLVAARADATYPSRTTAVAVNLTNVLPSSSHVRVVSRDPEVYNAVPVSGSFLWGDRLPDASRGDMTWLFQTAGSSGGTPSAARSSIVRYASLGLTIGDGGGAITAALQTAPQAQLRADLKLGQFAALGSAVNPAATADASYLEVRGIAHSDRFPDRPLNGFPVRLGVLSPDALSADADFGSLAYGGHFLDTTWVENAGFWYEWLATLHDPDDASKTVDTYPDYYSSMSMRGAPASWVPVLSPPTAPTIAGKDAFTPRSGVGLQPTIAWSAPAIGKPTSTIARIDGADSPLQNGDIFSVTATVYSGTSFVVPAGYLKPGRAYSALLTSDATSGDGIDTRIWGFSGNHTRASCAIGLFRP
ncbi:MAG: hypothetical protein ABR567_05470, partial [Myxococcales bacterium]